MKNNNSVLVFGDSLTAYGVISGLIESNDCDIYLIVNNLKGIACYSKYVKQIIRIDDDAIDYANAVSDFICTEKLSMPLLMIGGNDIALELLSKEHLMLSKIAIPTFPPWEVVKKVIHKEYSYDIAEQLSIPTIKTKRVTNLEELDNLTQNFSFNFPVFLKCTYSRDFSAKFGTKGVICSSILEINEAYQKYDGFLDSLLVQPLLKGDIDQITTVLLVVDQNGSLLSATVNEKVRSSKLYGSTTLSRSIWNQCLIERAILLVKEVGYYGTVGVQFKYDPLIDDFRFLEINGRFSVSAPLAQRCNNNLPVIVKDSFLGEKIPVINELKKTYKENLILWLPLNDISLLGQKRFYLNMSKYISPLVAKGYVIFPFSLKDPGPFISSINNKILNLVRVLSGFLKSMVKNIY